MLTMLKLPAGGVREEVSVGVIEDTMLLTNACSCQTSRSKTRELNF